MKITVTSAVLVGISCLLSFDAIAENDQKVPQVPEPISSYFERLDTVARTGSTKGDIEKLLSLMTEDVRYVHSNYQANFDLASWRAAFYRRHDNNGYSEPDESCTKITNSIAGRSHNAIEYIQGENKSGTCTAIDGQLKLVIFSLDDEKIQRIEELW